MSIGIGLLWYLIFLLLLGLAVVMPLRRRMRLRKSLQGGFVRSWELNWLDRRLIKNSNIVLVSCVTVTLLIVWWALLAVIANP